MRFITTWLVVLFLAAASGESTSPGVKTVTEVEGTTESSPIRSTTVKSITDNGKEIDLATDKDMTVDELFLIEKIIEDQEQNQKNSDPDNVENSREADDIDNNPENPTESKINKDYIDIRGQETNTNSKSENSSPDIQFDDSKTEVTTDPPQRYGPRARKFKQNIHDSAPVLQLTWGGYESPYKRSRYRDSYSPKPDSSEQSEKVQKLDRASNNKRQDTRRIVPHVTYSSSQQPSYELGQGSFMNPPFDASARNMLALNQIVPPPAQNEFLNSPPAEFTGYPTTAFQPQFQPSSDVGRIPNFNIDPNNAGVYQPLSRNPFQTPGILFQNSPQIQPQPVYIDAGRSGQMQLQQNPLPMYSGYETMGDSATPNYASFFRNPAISSPFQVPPNFYGNAPSSINPFNSPSISFLPQYPNFESGVPSQLLRYPGPTTGAQSNQQAMNNQQIDSAASQEEDMAKTVVQIVDKPVNRDDSVPAEFGTGPQAENIANVYMKYPVEAGYAVEENLPAQNNSDASKDDDNNKRSNEGEVRNSNTDPNKNALNPVRNNQRINNSFNFPPEFFSLPINFGYQRQQDGIPTRYRGRNRGISNYPSRNFEPRIPFNAVGSLPESFLGINNQQNVQQEANETPSCATGENATVCFEDNDYPKDNISYEFDSNSFLTDRLLSPEPQLNSFAFVERNGNETEQNEENYACDVATKYGMPLRAKNLAGMWRIIVNLPRRFSQPVRMEVCKTLGSSCTHTDSGIKTACVQKFSLQRLLTWNPSRGIYSDVYKIPVACSCQIMETAKA